MQMIWTTREAYQAWSQRPPPEGWEGPWPPPIGSGPWPLNFPGPPAEAAPDIPTWAPYERPWHSHSQVTPVPARTNSYKRAPKPVARSYRRTPSNDNRLDLFDTKKCVRLYFPYKFTDIEVQHRPTSRLSRKALDTLGRVWASPGSIASNPRPG
jgi:hypothetical protein